MGGEEGDENGGVRENGRPQSRTNAALASPLLRGPYQADSAAICERDRSSFQKLFLLWDLGLGGDQQETAGGATSSVAVGFFPLLPHLSHPRPHPDTTPRLSTLRLFFPLDPLLLFPLSLLRGRERDVLDSQVHPRDFWFLSSWCCRLSPAITGSVSLILLSPTSTGRAQTTTPSEPDRRRPAPAALHFALRYTTPISSIIDDSSPALGDYDGRQACHERRSLLT